MNYNSIKTELSGDLISRDAVLKEINCWIGSGEYRYAMSERFLIDRIKTLPPVTAEPKTGYWIEKDGYDGDIYYDCSECGESWATIEGTPWDNEWNYCPNCGCRMYEPQESEDEE